MGLRNPILLYVEDHPANVALMRRVIESLGGFELFVGETPGHGVDIDEKLAAKYPYKPAYLPVARLQDGTMWNW